MDPKYRSDYTRSYEYEGKQEWKRDLWRDLQYLRTKVYQVRVGHKNDWTLYSDATAYDILTKEMGTPITYILKNGITIEFEKTDRHTIRAFAWSTKKKPGKFPIWRHVQKPPIRNRQVGKGCSCGITKPHYHIRRRS